MNLVLSKNNNEAAIPLLRCSILCLVSPHSIISTPIHHPGTPTPLSLPTHSFYYFSALPVLLILTPCIRKTSREIRGQTGETGKQVGKERKEGKKEGGTKEESKTGRKAGW